ncbi:hypothetical protein KSS87_008414, partial [Heliosperma pusillum]
MAPKLEKPNKKKKKTTTSSPSPPPSDGMFSGMHNILLYQWIEDSLRLGNKVAEDLYVLKQDPAAGEPSHNFPQLPNINFKSSPQNSRASLTSSSQSGTDSAADSKTNATNDQPLNESIPSRVYHGFSTTSTSDASAKTVRVQFAYTLDINGV